MDYKIYKTDSDDLNPVHHGSGSSDYTASSPKTGADMNGADAFGAYHTYHLEVPSGEDGRNYAPSKLQSGLYENVEYKADNEGQGNVSLTFDGVNTIADTVSNWNAANVGNEISHDSLAPTTVPAAGVLSLSGDGEYHLVRDVTNIANAVVEDATAAIAVKYAEMKVDVLADMATTFGTSDPDSASAYLQTWEKNDS